MARKLKSSRDSPDIIHLSDCFQRLTLEDHSVDNDVEMTSPGREAFPNPPYGTLVKCLIRSDAREFVLTSYEDIYLAWTTLQQSTSFPSNIPCTDTRVASALSYLDAMITDRGNSHLLKRLAYVQLTRTVAALYELISNDRNVRAWPRKRQVHSDVAVDIYLRAQTRKCRRNEILRRMSLGKRWFDLAGPSPLLVVTYSDDAERVVYDLVLYIRRSR